MLPRVAIMLIFAVLAVGCSSMADRDSASTLGHVDNDVPGVGGVVRVYAGTHADLVVLNAGYGRNVRPGMQLILSRQGKAIASLVVAEATQDSAAALILDLTPNETVKAGDSAKVQTVVL